MRNPKWHREEIILALDLYFSPDRGSIDKKNPKIIALSKLLNALPIHVKRPDEEKFRNADGVAFKLSNFVSIDPDNKGKGHSHGSALDKKVFQEFANKRDQLRAIAEEIRKIAEDVNVKQAILHVEEDDQTDDDSVEEGRSLYKLHKVRERNHAIVERKKEQALKKYGKLACEACMFVFEDFYGPEGKDFIECHHRIPLASFKVSSKTTLDDLALVCANCHRILHRNISSLSIDQLREKISSRRET